MRRTDDSNPLRTGIFGIAVVVCLVLVSFGYTKLPFWPQGKTYEAFFTDAGGIASGDDVNVSGIKVGQVNSVGLAGNAAKATFTVDRNIRSGTRPWSPSRPTRCWARSRWTSRLPAAGRSAASRWDAPPRRTH